MHASTGNVTPRRPFLTRLLIRSWEYRYPRALARFRFACGVWNAGLGMLLLANGYWAGLVPLAGSALIFWTARVLRATVQS